ncbi:MAG TPA: AmmeMemoRadiSam system protein A [Gallionella sp.]|nr:AmmeMemoRadiSam system protein A [Gallionella sp.]
MSDPAFDQRRGKILLDIARGSIAEALGAPHLAVPQEDWLQQPGATFVTLTQHGELRGCIGTLEAHRPLAEDVYHNARAAAFEDPRFMPLKREELGYTRVEVSLLSPPQPMTVQDEADALAQLRPGVDGLVFEYGRYRSTFLPQVWEQLPLPRQFMAHLKRKAGLPEDFWSDDVRLSRYTVTKWSEPRA